MNCAVHPDAPVAAYCRTCGKALCENCKRDVRGVIYCEDCLAARLQGTLPVSAAVPAAPPPQGVPSPGLAAVLGLIPGLGAVYNGQYMKAFIHVVMVGALIWAANRVDIFGLFVAAFWFYMVIDAYKTAEARAQRKTPPDWFGLERMSAGSAAGGRRAGTTAPIGAIILIGLGVLFLLENLGRFHFDWVGQLWPVILIALGVWSYTRRRDELQCGCMRCRSCHLMGPAILVTLGVLALLSEFDMVRFRYTWPIILIVIGAIKIIQGNAPTTGHIDTTGPAPLKPAGTESNTGQVGNA